MTNLDQHSELYGTPFGVLGSLGGLLKTTGSHDAALLTPSFSTNSVTARRIRRRSRQLRLQ